MEHLKLVLRMIIGQACRTAAAFQDTNVVPICSLRCLVYHAWSPFGCALSSIHINVTNPI
jgi:hypothetical protein